MNGIHQARMRLQAARIADQVGDLIALQANQTDRLRHTLAITLGQRGRQGKRALACAKGSDHEEMSAPQLAGQIGEKGQRRWIRPLQIVDDQDQRLAAGRLLERLAERLEELSARVLGRRVRIDWDRRRALPQHRNQLGQLRGSRTEPIGCLSDGETLDPGSQHLAPGPIGGAADLGLTTPPERRDPLLGRSTHQSTSQRGRTHARRAGDEDTAATIARHASEGSSQPCQLVLAPHEGIGRERYDTQGRSGLRGRGRFVGPLDELRDESIAVAIVGLDGTPVAPALPERAAELQQTLTERVLVDLLTDPDLIEQLPLGHHPLTVENQVKEQVERLGAHGQELAVAPQLAGLWAELEIQKLVTHRSPAL